MPLTGQRKGQVVQTVTKIINILKAQYTVLLRTNGYLSSEAHQPINSSKTFNHVNSLVRTRG